METEENDSTKRKTDSEAETPVKKPKSFCGKEFRKILKNSDPNSVIKAVQDFSQILGEVDSEQTALVYLEAGGNCVELLQTLEKIQNSSPVQIFNIVSKILSKISTKYPQYSGVGYDTCRYILNIFIPLINKMIGLSSSAKERKAVLRLLTSAVSFASDFAKDILLTVNFNLTNIELLTKNTTDKDSVRDNFVHFLTTFLLEGQFATLSVLLEKRGLLTSIVAGLKYDNSDIVCMVLSAMKHHILESPTISKTAKMKVFNTKVVKDIVNLYNWKGPAGIQMDKKKTITVAVDEYEKSKVNKVVHSFLLVLCTSHRYGVIFSDHTLGLGKENQNKLVCTVLESLERPWDHSYAKELVVKICAACPDLTKTIWNHLKEYLTPRISTKWFSAIGFAKLLVEELQPSCLEFCIKELNIHQICQALIHLILPLPVLRTLLTETKFSEQPLLVKRSTLLFLKSALEILHSHVTNCRKFLTPDNSRYLQRHVRDYLTRNLPSVSDILENWSVKDDDKEADISCTALEFLEVAFDVLECYKMLNLPILEDFSIHDFDVEHFLGQIKCEAPSGGDDSRCKRIQISAIDIFFDIDPSIFIVGNKLFNDAIFVTLNYYYENPDRKLSNILGKLFKNTSVFETCENEIEFWIDGVLDLNKFNSSVTDFLVSILRLANENMAYYLNELSQLGSCLDHHKDISSIIENLYENEVSNNKHFVKHSTLSPLLLVSVDYLNENAIEKHVKMYFQSVLINIFHSQTSPSVTKQLIARCNVLPEYIVDYITNWVQGVPTVLRKSKCQHEILQKFSESFLNNDFSNIIRENENVLEMNPNLIKKLLYMSSFYFSNLLGSDNLNDMHFGNFKILIEFLFEHGKMSEQFLEIILYNPVVSEKFSILNLNKDDSKCLATKLILYILKELRSEKNSSNIGFELYQNKCVKSIHAIVKKPQKYIELELSPEILELFELSPEDSRGILETISVSIKTNPQETVPNIYFNLIMYAFSSISRSLEEGLPKNQLSNETFEILISYIDNLTGKQKTDASQFSKCLLRFLKTSPNHVKDVPESYFKSLLMLDEYNEDVISLIVYIFPSEQKFVKIVKDNIENIAKKKGLFLNILSELVLKRIEDFFYDFYKSFEPSIIKALNKPQKAGQHFEAHYVALGVLIEKCMPEDVYKNFIGKVHKFEAAEVFHAYLLSKIFNKALANDVTEKQFHNMFLTLVHLNMKVFKQESSNSNIDAKLNSFGAILKDVLEQFLKHSGDKNLSQISQNETVKQFYKFCSDFGISKSTIYLNVLRSIVMMFKKCLLEDDTRLIMNSVMSHAEFLDVVSGDTSDKKKPLLRLLLEMCEGWPQLMSRDHMPMLLSAYQATVGEEDRMILQMLKMCEMRAQETNFYEFKPLLWGKAAIIHYSVRQDIQKAIWKQPKVGDVLDILQENIVLNTIKNHPLTYHLQLTDFTAEFSEDVTIKDTYDLSFFLPLFSELLAPEYVVPTYKFAKSGALSLAIVALSNDDSNMRAAACHVLHRFYSHLEAKTSGKDIPLWLRFIEVICKGTSTFDDFKLNNFVSIFFSRMALILTDPNHIMYVPLSSYLAAKIDLDFNTIPELYTFLFSNDVNHEHHRRFILEILRDGCRSDKEVAVFIKSMAYKFIMQMYSCGQQVSNSENKLLILDILERVTSFKTGANILCENHSLFIYIVNSVKLLVKCTDSNRKKDKPLANGLLRVISNLTLHGVTNETTSVILNSLISKLETL